MHLVWLLFVVVGGVTVAMWIFHHFLGGARQVQSGGGMRRVWGT